MDDKSLAIYARLQDALRAFNDALAEAAIADMSVDLKVNEQGVVGRLAPKVHVSGQISKSRLEFIERL